MRTNNVKRLLKAGKPTVGTWLSLGNITAARFLARAGFDWLTVDVEHSLVNVETMTHMIASIADAGCVPLARVPSNRHDHIKRVLDNGGYGIVVPMVCTRAESEAAVSACLYPPRGTRSVGGSVHALNFAAHALEDACRDLLAGQIEASNANERAATQLRLRELEAQRAPPSLRGLTVPPPRVVEEQGRRDAELSASAGQLERLTQAALAESNARMRAIRPASEPKQR